ncbi:MAG: carbon-nitrogen hydrolase [Ignavibacteriaceae bacterium]|nr:carbon-nitrogen hydrolase [Ignavibacteriaceae bacterium]
MTKNKFNAGLVQFSVSENPAENEKKAVEFVKEAASKGADVICLPELYRSRYFCQKEDIDYYDLAEPLNGRSAEIFTKLAGDIKKHIIVPIFEKRGPGIYHNSLLFIDNNGKVAGVYRKMHIPDDPAYYEKFYFTPGDLGFKAFESEFGKIGTLICWDQWFPEGARLTSLQGAVILFYPTAIGWHPFEKEEHGAQQRDAWITVQRGHAIANGIYVAAANRTGFEKPVKENDGIQFWGSSFIADPQGQIIAQASVDSEEVLVAEINLDRLEYIRRNWPFLRDRRVEDYLNITKKFID